MPTSSSPRITPALLLVAIALAACAPDMTAPTAAPRLSPAAPHLLLGPNEFNRTITDSTDAAGNQISVTEYAAGIYTLADGTSASGGSVTIKTIVPPTNGSGSCITSTVVSTETTTGWTATVKKSGGCDKEIVVELENAATREKAVFRYLVIFGKTRIDQGRVS